MRLTTLIVMGLGTLFFFPTFTYGYFYPVEVSSDRERPVKWYHPPLFLIGSWIPALLTLFVFAPQVHQIHVKIPPIARKSRDELMRWASNVPRNTEVYISVIRLKPWPTARRVFFEDLQRLPFSFKRLTNLEWKPAYHEKRIAEDSSPGRARFVEGALRRAISRYYVSRTRGKDKSAVPGVWDRMWEQIPMEGEKAERQLLLEQKKAHARPPGPRILPPKPKT